MASVFGIGQSPRVSDDDVRSIVGAVTSWRLQVSNDTTSVDYCKVTEFYGRDSTIRVPAGQRDLVRYMTIGQCAKRDSTDTRTDYRHPRRVTIDRLSVYKDSVIVHGTTHLVGTRIFEQYVMYRRPWGVLGPHQYRVTDIIQ